MTASAEAEAGPKQASSGAKAFLGPEVGRNRAGEEAAGPSSLQKAGQSRLAQRGQRVIDAGDDRWI